ncbi:hypothetical protein CI102_1846 [Trichoderma harzianum]|nr:hypothetical protein CI102_1846 [Trichoderma harzianum]
MWHLPGLDPTEFLRWIFYIFFFPGLQRLPLTTALLQPQKLTYKQTSANSGQPAEFYSLQKQLSIIRPDEPLVIAAAARHRKIPKLRLSFLETGGETGS